MNKMRLLIPAAIVAASLAGVALAQGTPAPTGPSGGSQGHSHFHHRQAFGHLLHKLNLSAQQKSEVRALIAQDRSSRSAQMSSVRSNRAALASTSPSDPTYTSLVATAQANASAAVQARANLWTQIYAVLTPDQKAQIPGIVAAEQARRAQWQAQHGNS